MLLKITLFAKRTLYIVDIVDCELANMPGHERNQKSEMRTVTVLDLCLLAAVDSDLSEGTVKFNNTLLRYKVLQYTPGGVLYSRYCTLSQVMCYTPGNALYSRYCTALKVKHCTQDNEMYLR